MCVPGQQVKFHAAHDSCQQGDMVPVHGLRWLWPRGMGMFILTFMRGICKRTNLELWTFARAGSRLFTCLPPPGFDHLVAVGRIGVGHSLEQALF